MYVTEIKEKQIFQRIRWQLRIFESVFYKSLIRACSFGNWYVMTFVNSKLTEITTNFYFIVSEDIQKEFRCISSRHWPLWYTWIGYRQVNGPPRTLTVSLRGSQMILCQQSYVVDSSNLNIFETLSGYLQLQLLLRVGWCMRQKPAYIILVIIHNTWLGMSRLRSTAFSGMVLI